MATDRTFKNMLNQKPIKKVKEKSMFKSQSQRRFMYSQKPELAKKFESETPRGISLPEKVSKPSGFKNSAKKYSPWTKMK